MDVPRSWVTAEGRTLAMLVCSNDSGEITLYRGTGSSSVKEVAIGDVWWVEHSLCLVAGPSGWGGAPVPWTLSRAAQFT
jgi:hypothetical protein